MKHTLHKVGGFRRCLANCNGWTSGKPLQSHLQWHWSQWLPSCHSFNSNMVVLYKTNLRQNMNIYSTIIVQIQPVVANHRDPVAKFESGPVFFSFILSHHERRNLGCRCRHHCWCYICLNAVVTEIKLGTPVQTLWMFLGNEFHEFSPFFRCKALGILLSEKE